MARRLEGRTFGKALFCSAVGHALSETHGMVELRSKLRCGSGRLGLGVGVGFTILLRKHPSLLPTPRLRAHTIGYRGRRLLALLLVTQWFHPSVDLALIPFLSTQPLQA
jgi:hypothetical protein